MSNTVPDLTIKEPGVGPGQDYWPTVPGAAGSPSLAAFSQGIIWRPGALSLGNVVGSWAEVQAAIAATNGALNVLVDDSIAPAVVSVGTTDCQDRVVFTAAFQHELPSEVKMVLPDGAVLHNPRGFTGFLTLRCQGTTTPNLTFTKDRADTLVEGAVIDNVGTQPVIRLAAGAFFVITLSNSSLFTNVTPGSGPLVDLSGAGAIAVLFSVTGGGYATDNVITGVPGSVGQFQYDASLGAFPANPGFGGTIQKFVLDDALFIDYEPAAVANWSGVAPTSIANALDRIAAKIGPIA